MVPLSNFGKLFKLFELCQQLAAVNSLSTDSVVLSVLSVLSGHSQLHQCRSDGNPIRKSFALARFRQPSRTMEANKKLASN